MVIFKCESRVQTHRSKGSKGSKGKSKGKGKKGVGKGKVGEKSKGGNVVTCFANASHTITFVILATNDYGPKDR